MLEIPSASPRSQRFLIHTLPSHQVKAHGVTAVGHVQGVDAADERGARGPTHERLPSLGCDGPPLILVLEVVQHNLHDV